MATLDLDFTESDIEKFKFIRQVLLTTEVGKAEEVAKAVVEEYWYWPQTASSPGSVEAIVRWTGLTPDSYGVVALVRARSEEGLSGLLTYQRQTILGVTNSGITSTSKLKEEDKFLAPYGMVGHP